MAVARPARDNIRVEKCMMAEVKYKLPLGESQICYLPYT